mmetsp:Transcript_12245/g.18981  ORF Transcript_12245/g.18981 Transcript_12245/m.18981 type:complete len:238 (+) Transcript_12245:198-911(+)
MLLLLIVGINWEELVSLLQLLVVPVQQRQVLVLDELGSHSIFSVEELDDLIPRSSHSLIVLDLDIFKCLDKSSLDVASIGSLDCCIDQSFSSSHGMEVELLRGQPQEVAAENEALAFGSEVVLTKVGQRSAVEPERNTLASNVLLADTRHNLRDIELTTFGTSSNHVLEAVIRRQIGQGEATRHIKGLLELLVDSELETVQHTHASDLLELSSSGVLDDFIDCLLVLNQLSLDLIES